MLGKELGHGGQFPCADLDLGGVDLVLLLGLPELIDPAEAVGGGEHVQRQVSHQALQFLLVLRRQDQFEDRRIEPEDLWQHAGGEPGRKLPSVGRTFIGGEVFTLFEGDGHGVIRVGIHQQIVLGQEAGKQHSVPVLVGDFFHKTIGSLFTIRFTVIAQLPSMHSQTAAQVAIRFVQMRIGVGFPYAKLLQCGLGSGFGNITRILDGALELMS